MKVLREAKKQLISETKKLIGIRPWYNLNSVLESTKDLSTSAGYGMDKKFKSCYKVYDTALNIWDEIAKLDKSKLSDFTKWEDTIIPVPCTLASRGHMSPIINSKARTVWVYPYQYIMLEAMFAMPV